MSIFWNRRPGIVNVRMVITEEKILSNIDKIQKLINPNSKKQIVQLDDDAYFKDLIDLYYRFKNSKMMYRVPFKGNEKWFKLKSKKSNVGFIENSLSIL